METVRDLLLLVMMVIILMVMAAVLTVRSSLDTIVLAVLLIPKILVVCSSHQY